MRYLILAGVLATFVFAGLVTQSSMQAELRELRLEKRLASMPKKFMCFDKDGLAIDERSESFGECRMVYLVDADQARQLVS